MVHTIKIVINMPNVSKIAIIFDPNCEFIPVNEEDFSLRKTIVDLIAVFLRLPRRGWQY